MKEILNAFKSALEKSGIDTVKVCVVSDFLAQPEIVEDLGCDSFHVARGRAIPFGTGLKLANPELKVVVLVGDVLTLGGNHFMHAARRGMDLVVICVNNFVYPKIGGNLAPAVESSFSTYATFERPVNVPHVARSSGAVYVARWTARHESGLTDSLTQALRKRGFSLVEVISPGTGYFAGMPDLENQSEILEFYYENSMIKDGEDTKNVEIDPEKKIVVGKFFEQERPTYIDSYNTQLSKVLGDKFQPYGIPKKHDKDV